jgi:hypothetical protein
MLAMQLIIHAEKKRVYAYLETDKHFAKAEKMRKGLRRLPLTVLDEECDLSEYGTNFYIVVPVTQTARRSTKQKQKTA